MSIGEGEGVRNGSAGEAREDRLWRPIASLTPAKKRAFRLQSRVYGGEEKAYVRLFDAVERQENPDPEGVRRTDAPTAATTC